MAEEEVGHHLGKMGKVREEEGGRDGAALLAPLPSLAAAFLHPLFAVGFPGWGWGSARAARVPICANASGIKAQRTLWEEGTGWNWRHPLLLVPLGFTTHGGTRLGT